MNKSQSCKNRPDRETGVNGYDVTIPEMSLLAHCLSLVYVNRKNHFWKLVGLDVAPVVAVVAQEACVDGPLQLGRRGCKMRGGVD